MTSRDQAMGALELANAKRTELARLRKRIASERGALRDVLLDPPEVMGHMMLIDVVRLTRSTTRSTAALHRLGQLAVRDHVNLMVPLAQSSLRTREWVAENADWHWFSGRRRLEVAAA